MTFDQDQIGQTLFVGIALLTGAYVVCSKRRVDFLTLSYFGAILYFLPGFLGFTYYLDSSNLPVYVPISSSAYIVMGLVLTIITLGIVVCHPPRTHVLPARSLSGQYWGLIGFTAASLLMLYLTLGYEVLASPEKLLIQKEYGSRWLIWFEMGAFAAVVTALYSGKKRYLFLALLAVPIDLFLGFRIIGAFTAAAIAYTHLERKGPIRLYAQWRLFLLLIAILYGLLLYKQLAYAAKNQDASLVWNLMTDSNTYLLAIIHSEPFVVANNLTFATTTAASLNFGYVGSWPLIVLPFLPEAGMDLSNDFTTQFQDRILPGLSYGVGGNPWAEFFLMGSFPLVVVGASCYVAALRLISVRAANSPSSTVQIAALAIGSIWCFYFNRNEISFQLYLTRNVVVICCAAGLLNRWCSEWVRPESRMRYIPPEGLAAARDSLS